MGDTVLSWLLFGTPLRGPYVGAGPDLAFQNVCSLPNLLLNYKHSWMTGLSPRTFCDFWTSGATPRRDCTGCVDVN